MKYNWKKIDKIAGYIVGIGFLLFIVYYAINQEVQLAFFSKYSIAKVVNEYRTGHLVKSITYKYSVNGTEYERSANKHEAEVGKRYFIKFSSLNPNHNRLLQNLPVPDNVTEVPENGWDEIPKQ